MNIRASVETDGMFGMFYIFMDKVAGGELFDYILRSQGIEEHEAVSFAARSLQSDQIEIPILSARQGSSGKILSSLRYFQFNLPRTVSPRGNP